MVGESLTRLAKDLEDGVPIDPAEVQVEGRRGAVDLVNLARGGRDQGELSSGADLFDLGLELKGER